MKSRREFLLTTVGAVAVGSSLANTRGRIGAGPGEYSVNVFSKHLQWLDYAAMASTVKAMGFDGIDLTVRPEGHVLPARVADDLPRAVQTIRKEGLNVHMITTAITLADATAESILKTAASLGIPYYRTGWISYDDKESVKHNLVRIQEQLTHLAELNKKYQIQGHYQNHSGTNFGAPVWDLGMVLEAIHSPWIGSQYDILHATVEGANAWPLGMKLLKNSIGTMDIKDFHWIRKDGKWHDETVPLGEGMVDWRHYFGLIKEYNIRGPFSLHFEYPLGGAENGATVLTVDREKVITAMTRDLKAFRKLLLENGIM